MAGVVGLDWRRFTFAELRRMYLARLKHDSGLTARLELTVAQFAGFGGKERKRLKIEHFDPMHESNRKGRGGIPLTKERIRGIDLPEGKHKPKPVRRAQPC